MTDLKIPYTKLLVTLQKILLQVGFSEEKANRCAELFAKANLDGVASHGLNRFPAFIELIEEGHIDVKAEPTLISDCGLFQRWDGQHGPGNLNAYHCMDRAIRLSKKNGIGCVALRNTNHWMRAGNFGWQAVAKGCIGICFTNTKPNMPGWGGKQPILGNNPLVIGFPRKEGPIVLDMAMSQFSYGKMSSYLKENKTMPFEAGFDPQGYLTKDPGEIIQNEMALPIGLWKGAGFSLLLDLIAAVLANGNAVHEIGKFEREQDISQVFICIYPPNLGLPEFPDQKVNEIIHHFKSSATFGLEEVRYPGENVLAVREKNLVDGVPVDQDIWKLVLELLKEK